MADPDKTVFLSYRRDVSGPMAHLVRNDLVAHGFDVFMDVGSLGSGEFEPVILREIEARTHFLVLLEPGSLDRIGESGDWLRREIAQRADPPAQRRSAAGRRRPHAHVPRNSPRTSRACRRSMPSPLPHEYLAAAMEKLRERFRIRLTRTGVVRRGASCHRLVGSGPVGAAALALGRRCSLSAAASASPLEVTLDWTDGERGGRATTSNSRRPPTSPGVASRRLAVERHPSATCCGSDLDRGRFFRVRADRDMGLLPRDRGATRRDALSVRDGTLRGLSVCRVTVGSCPTSTVPRSPTGFACSSRPTRTPPSSASRCTSTSGSAPNRRGAPALRTCSSTSCSRAARAWRSSPTSGTCRARAGSSTARRTRTTRTTSRCCPPRRWSARCSWRRTGSGPRS